MDADFCDWRSWVNSNYIRRKWCVQEDVVISGMSGRFAESDNIQEFTENLFGAVDMTTGGNDRFPSGIDGFPMKSGKIRNLEDFDSQFFKIRGRDADLMDPQSRKLLEVSFEAIVDAGVSMVELNGSNTGVFYASCQKETDVAAGDDPYQVPLYQQERATVLSRAYGLKGPVAHFDTACASSFSALNEAFTALKSGLCNRALVAGYNICLKPMTYLELKHLRIISSSGKCKSLDESADGYAKSEAVCCVVLQLRSEAKRIYSTIVNCRTNCDGYKERGNLYPSSVLQRQLIAETYDEVGLDPSQIDYIEAHATGTRAGDPVELEAIYDVFCQQRSTENPLRIGCLKSNIGHSEGASGLCTIVKTNIIFQHGFIPPNLHFRKSNPKIKGLMDGRMVPVLERTPFEGKYISLNSFGFGGLNVHIVLERHELKSSIASFQIHDKVPRLIPICSRSVTGIQRIQRFLREKQDSLSREFFDLLGIYSLTPSIPNKGYTLVTQVEGKTVLRDSMPASQLHDSPDYVSMVLPLHPIIFDTAFQHIQAFVDLFDRLSKHIEPLGLSLGELLFEKTRKNSIIEETVSTIASQLLLFNLLKSIKVPIRYLIGDGLGQLTYLVAEGLIAEERAIETAYELGHFMSNENISSEQDMWITETLNGENFLHCGERRRMKVPSTSGYQRIGYIKIHRESSEGSPDQEESPSIWSLDICNFWRVIEEYGQRNDLFERGNDQKITLPADDSIQERIEVLPSLVRGIHGLSTNSVLIDSSTSKFIECDLRRIHLLDDDHLGIEEFLKCVGQLYMMNLTIDIRFLYPPVGYPVPIDTPSLHSLIDFDHSRKCEVRKYPEYFKYFSQKGSFVFKVSLNNAGDWFQADHHKIDGRILFPATGILMQVWLVVAEYHHVNIRKSKLVFSDVSFVRATMLSEKEVSFKVDYMPETNSFITSESDTPIATGKVFIVDRNSKSREIHGIEGPRKDSGDSDDDQDLLKEDIYKELKNRGYDYGPSFRCLIKADPYGRRGIVEWRSPSLTPIKSDTIFEKKHQADLDFLRTWITFSDSVMQLAILSNRHNRGLFVPTSIGSILIDTGKMMQHINDSNMIYPLRKSDNEAITFSVEHDLSTRTIKTDGLSIQGLKTSLTQRKMQKVLIETQDFIPFNEEITIEPKHRKELEKYLQACEKYSTLLLNESPRKVEDLDVLKKEFDYEENSSFSLLGSLISIHEQSKKVVNLQEIAHDMLIGKDLHLSSLSRFLKPFIVIPLNDRLFSDRADNGIAIMEYNDGKNLLIGTIKSSIDNQSIGMAKLSYSLASSTVDPEVGKMISGKANLVGWDAESPLVKSPPVDLLIYKNHSGNISSLHCKIKHLTQAVEPGGFLLVVFREKIGKKLKKLCSIPQLAGVIADLKVCHMKGEDVISLMEDMNWICVSNRALEPELLSIRGILFRRKFDTSQVPRMICVSPLHFQWLRELQVALEESDAFICLIGDPDHDQGVVGFMRSLGLEGYGDRIICIADRFHGSGIESKSDKWMSSHLKQILEKRLKFNIFDPVHGWGEYIHLEVEEKHEEDPGCLTTTLNDVELRVLHPGDLTSLKWCESTIEESLDHTTVDICYASLNFKDIMLASARLPMVFEPGARKSRDNTISNKIGLEYSGVDDDGNRLMGMKSSGAMASRVLLNPTNFVWPVPDDWTLEDAATVPVVYATVIYGLIMRGNLKRGESVLIHAGSGGVGIAAINICLSYDCTIYTTVGTPEKRRFITETFPHLNEANIGNSRDTSFEELIFRQTGGRGVDIVLNSLADDKLQASIRCLAPGGRFIEIGKYDGFKNSPVDLGWLDQDRSFHGVMLDALFDPTEDEMVKVNHEKNQLQDLVTKFLKNGVIKPLIRTIFEMKHAEDAFRYMAAGRHIGKVLIKIRDSSQIRELSSITALNSVNFQANKAYIIIGGFGGLGLEVASWLVSRGARHIVINSRNGPRTPYHQYCLDKMIENNVQVIISKHDLTTEIETRELLQSLSNPVGGIFNTALVLNDALFINQTAATFATVCDPKINITINMDKISREMCPLLDYFVVFSSVASGRGNPGQTNYCLANSFMESVCERRRRDGLHGLAIQWGLIGDVGYVVEKMGANDESIRGTAPQRLHSCLTTLERILNYPDSAVSCMVRYEGQKVDSSDGKLSILESLCHIIGVKDINSIDPNMTLGELGMDSLMAVEVQQALDRNLSVTLVGKKTQRIRIRDLIMLTMESNRKVVQPKSIF